LPSGAVIFNPLHFVTVSLPSSLRATIKILVSKEFSFINQDKRLFILYPHPGGMIDLRAETALCYNLFTFHPDHRATAGCDGLSEGIFISWE
jgi:hypothetical protein